MISKTIFKATTFLSLVFAFANGAAANQAKTGSQLTVQQMRAQLAAEDKLEALRQERYAASRRLKEIAIEETEIREAAGLPVVALAATATAITAAENEPKKKQPEGPPTNTKKEGPDASSGEGPGGTTGNEGNGNNDDKNKFNTKFGGIEFGAGIGFSYDLGQNDRVVEAELDGNNIVRIKKSNNVQARLMLESHYFFTPTSWDFLGLKNLGVEKKDGKIIDKNKWGIGPFVAIQPGGDNLIEAVGGGLMVGFRRSQKTSESFNIGVGVLYDINSKTLGDGILPDQPLPVGENEIRFREQSQSGLLIMSSYAF